MTSASEANLPAPHRWTNFSAKANESGRVGSTESLMTVRVKICGITNLDDALAAIEAGADALGFVFCESSPRCVEPGQAKAIIRELPPFVAKVGLFVNSNAAEVEQVIAASGIDTLQFHGEETPEYCRKFSWRVIKAFRVRDESSLPALPNYRQMAWLLDSFVPGKLGGTGEVFNWELARRAVQLGGTIVLAGGLTPENVAGAIAEVQPYAVDVSSGVEVRPGKKDHAKLRAFVAAAKRAR